MARALIIDVYWEEDAIVAWYMSLEQWALALGQGTEIKLGEI